MKKVALYARVSSDEQKERKTVGNQVETLETYIDMKKNEYIKAGTYIDEGISGTVALEGREDGGRLIKDASKGMFDAVLVWKIDRFGRDTLTGLQAAETLANNGIEIISVTEPFDLTTPTGRFQFITYLNMAELERNNILDRMFLGATRAAKANKYMGGVVPYGYKVENKEYKIDEEEAEVIKEIYDMYVYRGFKTIDIAVYLNAKCTPTSCMSKKDLRHKSITGKWRSGSIARILSSTTYKGICEYGKSSKKRKETILQSVPPIVDEELWQKAQDTRKNNTIVSTRNANNIYLLRGLVNCGRCGHSYYGMSYKNANDVYTCGARYSKEIALIDGKCYNPPVNKEIVENYVWGECLEIIENFEELVEKMKASEKNEDGAKVLSDIKKIQHALSEKAAEKNNLFTLFRKSKISEADLDRQMEEIRIETDALEALKASLVGKDEAYKQEHNLIETSQEKIKYYRDRINNLTFEEKQEIVKLLVKEIIITSDDKDNAPGRRGSRINIDVTFNLICIDTHKGMRAGTNFDILKSTFYLKCR